MVFFEARRTDRSSEQAFSEIIIFKLVELKGRQLQHFLQPGDIDLSQETLRQFHPGTRFVAKINI